MKESYHYDNIPPSTFEKFLDTVKNERRQLLYEYHRSIKPKESIFKVKSPVTRSSLDLHTIENRSNVKQSSFNVLETDIYEAPIKMSTSPKPLRKPSMDKFADSSLKSFLKNSKSSLDVVKNRDMLIDRINSISYNNPIVSTTKKQKSSSKKTHLR